MAYPGGHGHRISCKPINAACLVTPMKKDPYGNEQTYLRWKQSIGNGIPELSPANSDHILRYLADMEIGINVGVGSKKGPRSYIRLNALRHRMILLARKMQELYGLDDVTKVSENQLHSLFAAMKDGSIPKADGGRYMSTSYYVKAFKAFWHWHMRVQRKTGRTVPDITIDLDARPDQPKWVYLTEEQIKRLCNSANHDYKVLMMFIFDSGIRCPTELVNIRVADLYDDCTKLHIPEEISKTFGRKINLLLCPGLLREYIRDKGLATTDYVFPISPSVVNRYLKRLATRVLGEGVTPAGDPYTKLTMYDFRHSSACYWLSRYKSESALMYRFGWKKSEEIHYYTQLLGMRDTISEDDLLINETKTDLERRLDQAERDKTLLQEQVTSLQQQMKRIDQVVDRICSRIPQEPLAESA
jgi:integrase